jgi:hypothetical protein
MFGRSKLPTPFFSVKIEGTGSSKTMVLTKLYTQHRVSHHREKLSSRMYCNADPSLLRYDGALLGD